jgi:hypothetical protein
MEISEISKQFQEENLVIQKRIIGLYKYLKLKCVLYEIIMSEDQEDKVIELALQYSHRAEPEAIVNMIVNAARQKNPKKVDKAIRREFIMIKGGKDEQA